MSATIPARHPQGDAAAGPVGAAFLLLRRGRAVPLRRLPCPGNHLQATPGPIVHSFFDTMPRRRRFFGLLCATCGPWLGAATRAAPLIDLSAEAVELIGREAVQARQLADTRRRLARAKRDQARARSPEAAAKLEPGIAALEQQARQMEALQRQQLPARQVRELPVAALKAYVERVRRRIELHGDQHVPEENGQPLYGATDIAFTLRADGTLAHLQVQRAVPRALGLQTALLVQQLAPFEPFPRSVAAKVERISFIRSFHFEPGGEALFRLRSRPAQAAPR